PGLGRIRRAARALAAPSNRVQRLQQILHDVVGMLEAGRKPDQPVANAELRALLGSQSLVRGRGRMRDETLGVAKIVGDADELERILETESACFAALDVERA